MMYIKLPLEFETVLNRVKEKDWLITCYDVEKNEIYSPYGYLYNKIHNGINYYLVIDRNVFQYIIKSTRSKQPHSEYKDAIALIVFCQIAEISIEPSIAIYEKINYSNVNAKEAIEELQDFYNLDSSDTYELVNYVLGKINQISVTYTKVINKEKLEKQLTEHERLIEWNSFYLLMLKLISISQDNDKKKLYRFFEWMIHEFRLSIVVIVYAIVLFFNPLSKMIKYRKNDSKEKKIQQVRNMTWDIYFMNRFLRLWQNKGTNEEIIFASNDNVIKKILPLVIEINKCGSFEPVKKYINDKDYKELNEAADILKFAANRVYDTDKWTIEYRKSMIEKLEETLL